MITFTPLSGAVGASQTSPLAYLLQLDDIRVLLDCGSPDWNPEQDVFKPEHNASPSWTDYCHALRQYVLEYAYYTYFRKVYQVCTYRRPRASFPWRSCPLWIVCVRLLSLGPQGSCIHYHSSSGHGTDCDSGRYRRNTGRTRHR